MNKAIFFLIHIPVWIVAISFVFIIELESGQFTNHPLYIISETIIISSWFLAVFYLYFSLLVPKYLESKKLIHFIIFCIISILITPFFVNFMVTANRLIFGIPTPNRLTIWGYLGGVFGSFITAGLGTFYRFGIDWFRIIQVRGELENKNLQSELKILKSKLNPHLLFNTLNNIDTLIQTDSEQASHALSKLSGLLRYIVYDTEKEKISLQKEIEIIQVYIDLEKMRIINPDSVDLIISVKNDIQICPMIFFPFIENAFKHSNLNDPEHKLSISISEKDKRIIFNCVNTINYKKQKNIDSGVGLELAKKRLNLLYPAAHIVNIEQIDNKFCVSVEIYAEND